MKKKFISLKNLFLVFGILFLSIFFLPKNAFAQASAQLLVPTVGYKDQPVEIDLKGKDPAGIEFVAIKREKPDKTIEYPKDPCDWKTTCDKTINITYNETGEYLVCGYIKGRDGIVRDSRPDCATLKIEIYLPPPEGTPKPPVTPTPPPGEGKIPEPGAPKPGVPAGPPIFEETEMPRPALDCEKTKTCQSCPSLCSCACKDPEPKIGGFIPCGRLSDDPSTRACECCPCDLCSSFIAIKRVSDFLLKSILLPLCVIALIYAALLFITQGASPEKVRQGRNILKVAAITFALTLVSWVLINTIVYFSTGKAEKNIGVVLQKRWNQIQCPLPKGACEVWQPPRPPGYFCGDGIVMGDEECDPKENYPRYYLRTKKGILDWYYHIKKCFPAGEKEECTLKKVCDPAYGPVPGDEECKRGFADVGLGCYLSKSIDPTGCSKGECVCDPDIGDLGKVICANVFGDPKYKDHPHFIAPGAKIIDECCYDPNSAEFKTGEIKIITPGPIKQRFGARAYKCDDVCKEMANGICVGVGLTVAVGKGKCVSIRHHEGHAPCPGMYGGNCVLDINLQTNDCRATYYFTGAPCFDPNCAEFEVRTTGCYCRVFPTIVKPL